MNKEEMPCRKHPEKMKRIQRVCFLILCAALLLSGCGKNDPGTVTGDPEPGSNPSQTAAGASEKITNKKIPINDITDFYYTYENINYNAFYQRYRFYTEDGKYMFHHETREKPGDYGWTTEEDITVSGTFELSKEEWLEVFEMLKDGTVRSREDSAEAGSSGPWTYIYWKNDKSKYQKYDFASGSDKLEFEEFCAGLAGENR